MNKESSKERKKRIRKEAIAEAVVVKPSHKQVQALDLAHERVENCYPNVTIIKNTFHDDSKSVSVFGKSDDGRDFFICGYQSVGGDCFGRTQKFFKVTSLAY